MKMGEFIKHLRTGGNKYEKRMTQEELGKLLDPPVNRAAVNKWEKGRVENLSRTYIIQLSHIFGIAPAELLCFEERSDEENLGELENLFTRIERELGEEVVFLLNQYNKLNPIGKEKVLDYLSDLVLIEKYNTKSQ